MTEKGEVFFVASIAVGLLLIVVFLLFKVVGGKVIIKRRQLTIFSKTKLPFTFCGCLAGISYGLLCVFADENLGILLLSTVLGLLIGISMDMLLSLLSPCADPSASSRSESTAHTL